MDPRRSPDLAEALSTHQGLEAVIDLSVILSDAFCMNCVRDVFKGLQMTQREYSYKRAKHIHTNSVCWNKVIEKILLWIFSLLCLFYVTLFVGRVNCFNTKIAFHEIEEVMFSRMFLSYGPKFSVCIIELQAVYVYLMQRPCMVHHHQRLAVWRTNSLWQVVTLDMATS